MNILANPKHEAFAQAVASGISPAEAARKSGYSERSSRQIGYSLRQKHDVADRIATIEEQRKMSREVIAEKVGVTISKLLAKINEVIENPENQTVLLKAIKMAGDHLGAWGGGDISKLLKIIESKEQEIELHNYQIVDGAQSNSSSTMPS